MYKGVQGCKMVVKRVEKGVKGCKMVVKRV